MPDRTMIECDECGSMEFHEWEPHDGVWICEACGNVCDEDPESEYDISVIEKMRHVLA